MINTDKKNLISIALVLIVLVLFAMPVHAAIVPCGKNGQSPCTLCDLIVGIHVVIDYIKNIAIGLGILAFSVGGVMYAISTGDKGLIDTAKAVMKNAIIGFLVIFGAWLIVNTTISYIGTKDSTSVDGGTLGIHVSSWGNFECAPGVAK